MNMNRFLRRFFLNTKKYSPSFVSVPEVVQSTGNAVHAGTKGAAIVAARDVEEGEELLSDAHNPNERWRVDVVVMSRVDEGGEVVVHHLPLGLALDVIKD